MLSVQKPGHADFVKQHTRNKLISKPLFLATTFANRPVSIGGKTQVGRGGSFNTS